MTGDWWTTARQTVPRLARLARELEPTYRFSDVRAITPEFAARESIRAVVWDVDGTLMAYHAGGVDPELRSVLDRLAAARIAQAVVSNCGEARFVELGRIFPEFPVVRAYQRGGERTYRVLMHGVDSLDSEALTALRRAGARQVRKPDAGLLLQALDALGGIPAAAALMVGDQHLTDVATANLAGARSAKVAAWKRESFPLALRVSQSLERMLYLIMRSRGRSRSS